MNISFKGPIDLLLLLLLLLLILLLLFLFQALAKDLILLMIY